MPEYIEREAAIDALQAPEICNITPRHIELIKQIPSAKVAPVRHARWNRYYLDWPWTLFKIKSPYSFCTNCACAVKAKKITRYCPECGAKMDRGAGE